MKKARSILQLLLQVLLALLLMHCPGAQSPGKALNQYIQQEYLHSQLVPVYIATNRAGSADQCNNQAFQTNPNMGLRFGICETNVPKTHSIGSLDTSSDSLPDPNLWFKLGRYRGLEAEAFFQELSSESGDILVFVHGFNVKFEEAVLRAAQIRFDLKYQGPLVLYTWPAGGASGLFDQLLLNKTYAFNQANARQSVTFFADFIKQLQKQSAPIHIMIHSMGHQVVIPALLELHKQTPNIHIKQLVLNAPDYATQDFKKAAPVLTQMAERVTLYCSPGDNALLASVQFNGNHRIGQCALIDGIDVINVNEIDDPVLGVGGLGHGYYSGRPILVDLFQTLLGVEVQKRLFIRSSGPNSSERFILRK